MTKQEHRNKFITLRKAITPRERTSKNRHIISKVETLEVFQKAHVVLIYLALPDEVDTHSFIKKYANKKTFVAPRIIPLSDTLKLFEFTHPDHTNKNKYGISEPAETNKSIKPHEIDIALIPGVAFDLSGNRLGFGKGYYDRLLKKLRCKTIGLAYECQIVPSLPLDEHDEPVDMIVTEERIIRRLGD